MVRGETSMADIPNDIQRHMLKLLATNNGASDFVRATASCKQWKEFAEDANILKTVEFGSAHKIVHESFWKKNGFLNKCANANNKRASIIIARKKKRDKLIRMMQKLEGVQNWRVVPESIKELRRTDSLFFSFGI